MTAEHCGLSGRHAGWGHPAARSSLFSLGGKAFKGVSSGGFEIPESHQKNAYRLICAVQIGEERYVLHVFQKPAKTGMRILTVDGELVKQRYRQALELARSDDEPH